MKKQIENKVNKNGTYTTIETIETKPEDGFVHKQDISQNIYNSGKYHKGYSKTKIFSTNDPRITRPFVYGLCGFFLIIGIIILLIHLFTHDWMTLIGGLSITIMSILGFSIAKKDIDRIQNELKEKGNYQENLSREEIEEYNNSINNAWNEITEGTFTKDKFNWFLKSSILIYSIICGIIFLIMTIFVNIIFGIIVLILLILCGMGYYYLISKLFKH